MAKGTRAVSNQELPVGETNPEKEVISNPVPFESSGALEGLIPSREEMINEQADAADTQLEKEVVLMKHLDKPLPQAELTMEEKIVNFLDGKKDYVKMNDFLKSLYPVPTIANPAAWMQQAVSKTLKGLLESMVKEGAIQIANNQHLLLGKPYYVGEQQRQAHHNLTSIEIYGKI